MKAVKDKNNNFGFKKDILVIALFALIVFIALSLISYSPEDPSFFRGISEGEKVKNLTGIAGSHLSGFMLELLGISAYVVPLILFYILLRLLFNVKTRLKILRFFNYLIILLSCSALLSMIFNRAALLFYQGKAGGFLGDLISSLALRYLNILGAYIVLTVLFILSLMIATDFTFAWVGKVVKRRCLAFLEIRTQKKTPRLPPKKTNKSKNSKFRAATRADFENDHEKIPLNGNNGTFQLPPLSLLSPVDKKNLKTDRQFLAASSEILEKKLGDFGVKGKVTGVHPGPVITRFEFEPASGIKISKILGLSDDLALGLKALSIRLLAPIPGRGAVGIEVPNLIRQDVTFSELVREEEFRNAVSRLTLVLGKGISGNPVITDLARMPHLLIAGATGSGKSVCLNALICSVLFNATPDEVKFLLIDPKRLEFSTYEEIPHLLHPVVVDPQKAARALEWAVKEMERRYQLLAEKGVKDIAGYNQKIKKEFPPRGGPAITSGDENNTGKEQKEGNKKLPYIILIIDELADLMMVSSREVEVSIARLAQMARASGIHLLVATQRPSVDVLTGVIKANFPARISFKLASKVDSRTIIDTAGAERLLGAGDMLFLPPGTSQLQRIHGCYLSEAEISRTVDFLKRQAKPQYDKTILQIKEEESAEPQDGYDEKYDEAVALVTETRQASISMVQRRLRIGYNRAARIIETMEREGIVSKSDGVKPREVLMKGY